jgi:uncharacterized integral membrane protein (TIGR02327 family)
MYDFLKMFFQLAFQIVVIYLVFWSLQGIELGDSAKTSPHQIRTLRVFIAIGLGYLVSSFFINASQMIINQ